MNIAIIPKNNGEEEIVILEDNQEVLITRHYEGYKATYLSHRIVQSPSKEFLDWSAKSGYATSASDNQLALWEAWQAGKSTETERLVEERNAAINMAWELAQELVQKCDDPIHYRQQEELRKLHEEYILSNALVSDPESVRSASKDANPKGSLH